MWACLSPHTETFIRYHLNAFTNLGGIWATYLYDNPKLASETASSWRGLTLSPMCQSTETTFERPMHWMQMVSLWSGDTRLAVHPKVAGATPRLTHPREWSGLLSCATKGAESRRPANCRPLR